MSPARPFVRELGKGALGGALAFVAFDGVFLSLVALTAGNLPSEEAGRAMTWLGSQKTHFALLLLLGVGCAGVLVGVAQAALHWIVAPRPRGLLRHAAFTLLLGVLWTVRQFLARPALFGSALPELEPLTYLAVRWGPRPLDLVMLLAVAACLIRWIRRRPWRARQVGLVLLLLASLASGGERAPATGVRPNVLILAADSIRPDHLSLLGYARNTTPQIDALARSGILFDRALSPIARTTPAWISILSGQYPHAHGVRHMFPSRNVRLATLPSLVRVARARGYQTTVISDYAGDFFPKFDLGFSEQLTPPPLNSRTIFQRELIQRLPLALSFFKVLPAALRPAILRYLLTNADPELLAGEIIERLDEEQPFFMIGFFSATHAPFASAYPHHTRFTDPSYRGPHRFQYGLTEIADLKRADARPGARDIDQIVGLYDGALASIDGAVGQIVAAIDRRKLRDRTLIVFLSDHGENLFEPGQTTLHGTWFRGGDEANRVPLILSGPGLGAGRRISDPVSLVDVAPTLAAWLGWQMPSAVDGRPLVQVLRGMAVPDRPVFAETGLPLVPSKDAGSMPSLLTMLTTDREDEGQVILEPRFEDQAVAAKHRALWYRSHKLVYEPTAEGYKLQLFDLGRDPRQQRPVELESETGRKLRGWLFDWLRADPLREVDLRGRVRARRGG